ncbi:hypothetical protein F3D3_1157 [Fusibacter sp. 3D3]|nr:hypothetical protein F3D3_1157 [Fusibacter sp. 3D3]
MNPHFEKWGTPPQGLLKEFYQIWTKCYCIKLILLKIQKCPETNEIMPVKSCNLNIKEL